MHASVRACAHSLTTDTPSFSRLSPNNTMFSTSLTLRSSKTANTAVKVISKRQGHIRTSWVLEDTREVMV